MKRCVQCGKENIDEAIYCANCGASLNSLSSSSSSTSNYNSTSSSSYSSSSSNSQSGRSTNAPPKKERGLKFWCCYVPIILFVLFMVVALIYHGCAESFPVTYGYDYGVLDSDGDGRLSLDEASKLDPTVPDTEMTKSFNEADTNNNGYLKGHEFELFYDDIDIYNKYHGDSDSDKYEYSSSSSSSSSKGRDYSSGTNKYVNELNDQEFDSSSEGYVLTCPYCGSEAIYETGGYYKCAECGSSIYNPDDLELAYQEGYMDLLTPVSLTI